jgi:glycosyltransferase involved in cell wall biosynthesis
MNYRAEDSRVTVRPFSIGLYLDLRASHARRGEVLALAHALGELGHEATVYAVTDDPGEVAGAVPLVLPLAPAGTPTDRALHGDRAALVAELVARAPRHDVHHAFDALCAEALLQAKPAGRIVRTVTHLPRGASAYLEHLSAHSVRGADAVFAPSEALCTELAHRYRVRAFHVDTGVEVNAFAMAKAADVVALGVQLHLDAPGPVLLSFGGLPEPAVLDAMLVAFSRLHRRYPGARWVMEGVLAPNGGVPAAVEEALVQLSEEVRSAVLAWGTLEAGERASAYQLADALVCLGPRDAHLSFLLEAQAAGVPMLLADDPSLHEYVDPRCACWVDPRNAVALERDLMHASLLGRQDRRIVYAGYERAKDCTWARSAARHVECYRRVVFETPRALPLRRVS